MHLKRDAEAAARSLAQLPEERGSSSDLPLPSFAFPSRRTQMKLWSRRDTVAVIVVALAAAVFWIVENSVEIGEALQGTACRVWCPPLTPQELRLRVVKAHLHLSLASNMKWHDYGGKFQLALLPEMTEQDVIRGIAEGTLLETLTTRGTVLGSHAQIDC